MKQERILKVALLLALSVSACTESKKRIVGTIEITPEVQKTLNPQAVLYVIARPEGQTSGPPVAVKRFTQPIFFPLEFNLSAKDAMIPDTPLEGKFTVTARIAQTGSATPVQPGDIVSSTPPTAVAVGSSNLKIILNKVN